MWSVTLDEGSRMAAATILIVDDNRPLAWSLAELLARRSFRTLVAETASAALRLAGCLRPDLVIADLDLPDSSGADLAVQLAGALPQVPVILITAAGVGPLAGSAEASVFATLGKPFDPLRLVGLVYRALRRLAPAGVEFPLVQAPRRLPAVWSVRDRPGPIVAVAAHRPTALALRKPPAGLALGRPSRTHRRGRGDGRGEVH